MSDSPNISAGGVFFDTKNQKVVQSPPEEGVQLVAPGGEITPEAQADIDRYTDIENGVVREPETITTDSVRGKGKAKADAEAKSDS